MRKSWTIAALCFIVTLAAVTQDGKSEPSLSDKPLTSEQVAVYQAVLRQYDNGSGTSLNVSSETEPLEADAYACLPKASFEKPGLVVHKLDKSILPASNFVLVDAAQQRKLVEKNDPQTLVKKAIDKGELVSDDAVEGSVNQAFASGLFTLSEIAFNKDHSRTLVSYSFVCGSLCGHGDTLLLKKVGNKWKVAKTCGGWVS